MEGLEPVSQSRISNVMKHPKQDGYIITIDEKYEYATMAGDQFFEESDEKYKLAADKK